MDLEDKEKMKKIFEHFEKHFADFLDDDKCLKLFAEGYKKGYDKGYEAAMNNMMMRMCQMPPNMGQRMSEDGAQPAWWPWW